MTQPTKKWKVAPHHSVGGPVRHFADKARAFAFAQRQSQMSWLQTPWSVVHKPTGEVHHVKADGGTPRCCGRTH